jgi:hypothetical protein
MSIEALNWANRQLVGCAGRKSVLRTLADRADEQWSCFPSVAMISTETELCERSVQMHLRKLAADGFIAIKAVPGRRNRYVVGLGITTAPQQDLQVAPQKSLRPAESAPPHKPACTPAKNDISPTPPIKLNPQKEPKEPSAPTERRDETFRLPTDWPLVSGRLAEAAERGFTSDEARYEHGKFVDHFAETASGRKAKRTARGWVRSWTNWLDRSGGGRARPAARSGSVWDRIDDQLSAAAPDSDGYSGDQLDLRPERSWVDNR